MVLFQLLLLFFYPIGGLNVINYSYNRLQYQYHRQIAPKLLLLAANTSNYITVVSKTISTFITPHNNFPFANPQNFINTFELISRGLNCFFPESYELNSSHKKVTPSLKQMSLMALYNIIIDEIQRERCQFKTKILQNFYQCKNLKTQKRRKLIEMVVNQGDSLIKATKKLNVNLSTARLIIKLYKSTGEFFMKNFKHPPKEQQKIDQIDNKSNHQIFQAQNEASSPNQEECNANQTPSPSDEAVVYQQPQMVYWYFYPSYLY